MPKQAVRVQSEPSIAAGELRGKEERRGEGQRGGGSLKDGESSRRG